jgi:predicted RNA-binding protein with PUA-like domain
MATKSYFLLKTEAEEYGWSHLLEQGVGRWDGVRNYAARNQLRAMQVYDLAFFYHTGKERRIVGVVEVMRSAYPDPTAQGADFSCVEIRALCPLTRPVTLAEIKAEPSLAEMVLVRSSRLSVQPVSATQFRTILGLGATRLPKPSLGES